jgi:hypothetical protein
VAVGLEVDPDVVPAGQAGRAAPSLISANPLLPGLAPLTPIGQAR